MYSQWDKACKAWRLNINRYCDFIQLAMFWLAPKHEPADAISNMDPWWAGEIVRSDDRDSELSWLEKMVWVFHRSLDWKFSNPNDKAAFQAELYKNI